MELKSKFLKALMPKLRLEIVGVSRIEKKVDVNGNERHAMTVKIKPQIFESSLEASYGQGNQRTAKKLKGMFSELHLEGDQVITMFDNGVQEMDGKAYYVGSELMVDVSRPKKSRLSGAVTPSRAYLTDKSFAQLAAETRQNSTLEQDAFLAEQMKKMEDIINGEAIETIDDEEVKTAEQVAETLTLSDRGEG
jgi:hypothetical protein